ncbi:hypothetical protein OG194_18425 [Streptomyces sp. NBC_01288]|uniref:hypothetical protein n=1 Tax=Streptomyces sp. NBC_01288 TaxID=2903814 RepID=UPI002E14C3AA|nr:hypothetical protein OG194_18425 [Streptomyces sp. NBC_01288]
MLDVSGVPSVPGVSAARPSLASSPSEKRAAARAIEDHIEPGTRAAGRWADDENGAAVREFAAKDGEGWVTSAALKKAHGAWADQVKNLMDRLGAEKGALRSGNAVLTSTDLAVGSTLRERSALDAL